jgi:hypothetical protein
MSDAALFDQEAYRIAVASVRRHSMDINSWKHTVVGALHSDIAGTLELSQGEQVIASGFLSKESWWAVTTRRVATKFQGVVSSIDPRFGVESEFGNFKGIKRSEAPDAAATEVATVKLSNGEAQVRFEFETGKASMAPIYACMFWSRASRYHYGSGDA